MVQLLKVNGSTQDLSSSNSTVLCNTHRYFITKALDNGDGTLDWQWGKAKMVDQINKLELRAEAEAQVRAEMLGAATTAASDADTPM